MASNINVDIDARTVRMTPAATAAAEATEDVTSDSLILNDNEAGDSGGSDHVLTTKSPTRSLSTSSTQSLFVDDDEPNPLADFMSGDLMAKPFTYVKKTEKSFNPFRKKSGLLNVLARTSTKNRICTKKGELNLFTDTEVEKETKNFFGDIFVSVIKLNWGWINFIFATFFFLSWLVFAVIWYWILWSHGDFDPKLNSENNTDFTPCVSSLGLNAPFTSSYLFSLETQHTIGYGGRATTEECPEAIILMAVQSIVGVIISTVAAGIIFAKFTMPGKRGQTIVFSKNAVITIRNGALYLICRLCDLRKTSLLEPHVRMVIIRKEVTEEGEIVPYQQSDLSLTTEIDGKNDKIGFGVWPVTIAHKIDQDSPFYEMKPNEVLKWNFEIIVTLGGVTEETGNSIQVKTSYVPNEIMWGHQFDHNILEYDKTSGSYQVLHSKIHTISADETPRLSAKQLALRSNKRKANFMRR